jgi:RNA polymerase sigma-70 factor (sigma-E family)
MTARIGVESRTSLRVTSSDEAYTALFEEHYWGLVRLAHLLGADDPEDVVQEAFVRLDRRRHTLRDPTAGLAYLRSTVCNMTRNRLRHLRTARLRQPQLAEPVRDAASAEVTAVQQESARELLAALRRLPRRQHQVLVLRYWLDLSERDTAQTLGVAVGTVKAHAARGIAALARELEDRT